jgi:hypothetical protein
MDGKAAFVSKPIFQLLGFLIGVVILLWFLVGFFLLSDMPASPSAKVAPVDESRTPARPMPERSLNFLDNLVEESRERAEGAPPVEEAEQPSPPDEPWQLAINSILSADAEPVVLSQRLAVALPGMPLEGQLEAAQHMVNLLGDEEYATAENIYFNHGHAEQVRRVIFEDFMNRPNTLKLPLLVRTMREYGHPMRREAIDNLQALLGRNEGEDANRWDFAVREALEKERREELKASTSNQ